MAVETGRRDVLTRVVGRPAVEEQRAVVGLVLIPVEGPEVIVARCQQHRRVARALEEGAHVEAFVFDVKSETVVYFGVVGVSYAAFLVVAVDHAVVVQVGVLDVARAEGSLQRDGWKSRTQLVGVGSVGVLRADEVVLGVEPLGDVERVFVHARAGDPLVVVELFQLVVLDDLVAGEGERTAGADADLAEVVAGVQAGVDAPVVHDAVVLPRFCVEAGDAGDRVAFEQNALAAVVEVVGRQFDLVVEEAQVDADVAFGLDLPVDVVVDETQVVDTGAHAVRGRGSDALVEGVARGVERRTVEEAVGSRIVVTRAAHREADFRVVHHLLQPFGIEFLIGDEVADTYGGEEAEAVLLGEGFAAGVTEAALDEVAVVIRIGHAAHDALLAVGKHRIVLLLLLLHVEDHGAHVVYVVERALVVDGSLDVDLAQVARRGELGILDFGRSRRGRGEDQVALGVAAAGVVEARPVVAQRRRAAVVVETDASADAQTLSDEFQVLLQFDVRLDLDAPLLAVALVVEHVVGVAVVRVGLLFVAGQRAVAVNGREEVRRRVQHEAENIVGRTVGRAAVYVLSRKIDAQARGFAHLQVDVAAQVVTLESEVAVVLAVGVLLEDAVRLVVGHRDEVFGVLGAAAEVERVALAVHGLADQFVDPLRVRIEVVVHAVAVELDLGGTETGGESVIGPGFIGQVEVIPRVDEFGQALRRGDRLLDAERDFGPRDRTALGGYEDDAVGALGAVDGRRGGVLEDAEGLDFVGLDVVDVTGNSVDEHQRVGPALEGADAADPEFGVVASRLGAALDADQTGELAGEVARQVARRGLHQVARPDGGDRADHRLAFLLAVSDHDDLLDLVGVGQQFDVDHFAAVGRQGLRQVADVADRDLLFGLDVDDEESVGVGRRSDVGVLDVDGCADQRCSVGVGDGSGDASFSRCHGSLCGGALCVCRADVHRQEQQEKQGEAYAFQGFDAPDACFIKIFHTVLNDLR